MYSVYGCPKGARAEHELQAVIVVSLVGVCWAVACWVPFAIIMEVCGPSLSKRYTLTLRQFLKDREQDIPEQEAQQEWVRRPSHSRTRTAPGRLGSERDPLLRRRRSFDEHHDILAAGATESASVAGGTILGIHNLAIVFPQFIVRLCPHLVAVLV